MSANSKPKPRRDRNGLQQRGGVWQFRRTVMVDGKSKRPSFSTGQRDYKLAVIAARSMNAEMDKGELDSFIGKRKMKKQLTLRELCAEYTATLSNHGTAQERAIEAHAMVPVVTFFGDTPVNQVTIADAERFLAYLQTLRVQRGRRKGQPYAANMVRRFYVNAKMLFNRAVRHGLITVNPFHDVQKKLKPKIVPRERVVSMAEQTAFLAAARPEVRRAAIVLFGSGLRRKELFGLVEKDIDFANLALRLSITKGSKKRVVPMQPAVMEALSEQLAARRAGDCGGETARKQDDPRVFNAAPQCLNRWFTDTIEAAGIALFTPHDCRRTFGTRCADAGVPMHVLQEWMGHARITTTREFYVHLSSDASQRQMATIDLGLPKPKVVPFEKKEAHGTN